MRMFLFGRLEERMLFPISFIYASRNIMAFKNKSNSWHKERGKQQVFYMK
jgi:hypothetical protein